jgi:predicted secreted protein with PEFG-CTERM motif
MEYKAYALMAILLTSVGAVGTLGIAYAQTGFTVATDKTDYSAGDTIKISGNVGQTPTGQPLLIQVFNPKGAAYRFDQTTVAADGSYTYELKVGGKLGETGKYNVKVSYNGVSKETTFNFTAGQIGPGGQWKTTNVDIGGKTYQIQYMITGGTLNKLTADPSNATLTAMINSTTDGSLSLKLPREIMDSKDGGKDSDYVVFVDQSEDFADDDFGASVRTVTIPFSAGAEQIDVVGTFMVPEFGAIAAIVLAVAIVGIIVATTKYSKFSFMPKM